MAEEPDVIPPKGKEPPAQVTINQYIQLVDKTSTFPDGQALSSYSAEDRAWIKQRVEKEQDHRHTFVNKLVDLDAKNNEMANQRSHKCERERQFGAIGIILASVIICGWLLLKGVGVLALALPAVVLGTPIATGIFGYIMEKIEGAFGTKPPPSPPQEGGPRLPPAEHDK